MVTLYYATRSRSLRALWMLEEIGEPYERVAVDIRAKDHPTTDFLAVSPLGKVPAIVDGEARVAESGAILAYLADRFPAAGLAPPVEDRVARGRYLQWLFFAAANLEGAFLQKLRSLELDRGSTGWGSFEQVIEALEKALTPGPWLCGGRFTAADVILGIDLYYGREVMKIVPERPAIDGFLDRCLARPALQRAINIDSGVA